MDQGAQVWNLVATDLTGRVGSTPLLFFVDTEPPDIEIIYPTDDDRIDAQFRAAGRVFDEVGVESLRYSLSTGQSGEIPLTPGDPFWSLAVDLEPGSRGRLTADFTVRDVAGNERTERVRMPLDPAGDEPVVHRVHPREGEMIEQPYFAGHVEDDDGPVELVYTLNGGEQRRVPATQSFFVPLPDLSPGRHEIRYFAIDRHGVRGTEQRVRFDVATPLPDITLSRVVRGEQEDVYAAGFALEAREAAQLVGFVGGVARGRLNVTIGERSSTVNIAADGSFAVSLPRSNDPGLVDFRIRFVNERDRSVEIAGFYAQLPPEREEQASIRTAVLRERDTRRNAEWPTRVESARLPGIGLPDDLVNRRLAEFEPRDVAIDSVADIVQLRSRVVIGETEGAWSVSSETPHRLSPVLPAADGRAYLEIEATSDEGAVAVRRVPFVVDRQVPGIQLLTPGDDDVVNGQISVIARIGNLQSISAVSFQAPDSDEWITLPVDALLSQQVAVTDNARTVRFRVETHAGITGEQSFTLTTDEAADIPELLVQVPQDGDAVRETLRVAGVLLDDDRPEAIEISLNGSDPRRIPTDGLFDVALDLSAYPDGEYSVEITGFDIGGTPSEAITRRIVVSRSEPVVALTHPDIESFERGEVVLRGTAEDPNGIESVWVSVDSGASFRRAHGTEEWSLAVDSSLLDDATHSVLVRAYDTAGDVGIRATIINIDNTPPGIELQSPADGERAGTTLLVDGRIADCNIRSVRIFLQNVDAGSPAEELTEFYECGPFVYAIDTRSVEPGRYAIIVEADDQAGNLSYASRTVTIPALNEIERPAVLLPETGSSHFGRIDGVVVSPPDAGPVTLIVNGRPVEVLSPDARGRASFTLSAADVGAGELAIRLRTEDQIGQDTDDDEAVLVSLEETGPWLRVDAPGFLDYVRERPFLTGTAGYAIDLPEGDDRDTRRERDRILSAHAVEAVQVSLDNGATWQDARGTDTWRYRIETTELPDGRLNMVVRARYADGSLVTRRHSVTIDEQPPMVRLIAPAERARFSNEITVVGVTSDDNLLEDVAVALRPGNKSRYEVPGFIQGLYLDVSVLGATYWDVGAGLTFFDDNVRLQAQVGLSPPGRFSGLVIGTKLLANVAQIPASFFFGPDFEWLSAAVTLGANFSYFTMSDDTIEFTEDGLVLAGMLAQLEFPIVRVPELRMFNTYSLYTEAQLWFISSDVEAGTAFRLGFGLRTNVF